MKTQSSLVPLTLFWNTMNVEAVVWILSMLGLCSGAITTRLLASTQWQFLKLICICWLFFTIKFLTSRFLFDSNVTSIEADRHGFVLLILQDDAHHFSLLP
jgi:hypothetical protein